MAEAKKEIDFAEDKTPREKRVCSASQKKDSGKKPKKKAGQARTGSRWQFTPEKGGKTCDSSNSLGKRGGSIRK